MSIIPAGRSVSLLFPQAARFHYCPPLLLSASLSAFCIHPRHSPSALTLVILVLVLVLLLLLSLLVGGLRRARERRARSKTTVPALEGEGRRGEASHKRTSIRLDHPQRPCHRGHGRRRPPSRPTCHRLRPDTFIVKMPVTHGNHLRQARSCYLPKATSRRLPRIPATR